jgi:Pvc16 N-terminal domain
MSNVFSIAAVTATIKDLLENGLVSDAIVSSMGDVMVTALPPDRISIEADERPQLNLFLYQVLPNRNADWLSNTADKNYARSILDARNSTPPLALDLFYILTAYGAKDFQAELLLGYAIQLLHKIPVLTSDRIETALNNATKVSASSIFSQTLSAISAAELARNIGAIKISSEFLNIDEMSRLWSLFQTHYRPSTAYRVSMVSIPEHQQLDGSETSITPQIDRVTSIANRSITVNNPLLINGQNLRGEITRIRIGNKDLLLPPADVNPTQIALKIPPHLHAGIQGIQILHSAISTPQQLLESNLVAFVLHPEITATITQIQDRDKDLRLVDIAVKFNPKISPAQQIILRLSDSSKPHEIAYSHPPTSVSVETDSIEFHLTNIRPGTYLVSASVDGADSQPQIVGAASSAENRSGKHPGIEVIIL